MASQAASGAEGTNGTASNGAGRFAAAQSDRMRAVVRDRYGSPDVLRFVDIDRPVPDSDEVLVRVHATSLNTADLDYLRGRPLVARLGTGLLRPRNRVLGLDVAGRVEVVGKNVTRLRPGDEVWADLTEYGFGAFAEYVCAPENAFAVKPSHMTFEQAATIPHSAVMALQALRGGRTIQPGHKVLVNGAGGCVGPFAVQLAKSYGAEVTGVDHAGKLDLLRSIGADHVIDYTQEDFTRNGQRYDFILDIAPRGSILRYRRSLEPRGSYVQIAHSLSGFLQAMFLGRWITWTSRRKMGVFAWRPNNRADLERLQDLVRAGELTPHVDSHDELARIPDALGRLERGHARGKIVITC